VRVLVVLTDGVVDGVPRTLRGGIRLRCRCVPASQRHPHAQDEGQRHRRPTRSHEPGRRDGVVPERAASNWAPTETPKKMATDESNDHI
jgi:hypothetical protein